MEFDVQLSAYNATAILDGMSFKRAAQGKVAHRLELHGRIESMDGVLAAMPKELSVVSNMMSRGETLDVILATSDRSCFVTVVGNMKQLVVRGWGSEYLLARIKDEVGPLLLGPNKHNVYLLTLDDGTPGLRQVEHSPAPLERENYTGAVVAEADGIIDDICRPDPRGRIAVLHGEPGTGKTNLIRGIMEATPEATHVVVPSDILPDVTGPQFVAALINYRTEGRMVLIVEDADTCLARRDGAQADVVNVLNLADGIVGSLLDVFIIATTNIDGVDIDPALLRPGRMAAMVRVGPLDAPDANRVFRRLVGRAASPYEGPTTLAQVYADARRG